MEGEDECKLKSKGKCEYAKQCEGEDIELYDYQDFCLKKWSNKSSRSRVGIICTIGPTVFDSDADHKINKLIMNGMNIARINLSHSKLEEIRRDEIPKYLNERLNGLVETLLEKIKGKKGEIPKYIKEELKERMPKLLKEIEGKGDSIPKELLDKHIKELLNKIEVKKDGIITDLDKELKNLMDPLLKNMMEKKYEITQYLDEKLTDIMESLVKKLKDKGDEILKYLNNRLEGFRDSLSEKLKDKGDEILKCINNGVEVFRYSLLKKIEDKGDKIPINMVTEMKVLIDEMLKKVEVKGDEIPKDLEKELKILTDKLLKKIKDIEVEFLKPVDKDVEKLVDTIKTIRRCSDRLQIPVNIMLDLKGPEIRVAHFLVPSLKELEEGSLEIKEKGDQFTIISEKPDYPIEVKCPVVALSIEKGKKENENNKKELIENLQMIQQGNEYCFKNKEGIEITAKCVKNNYNKGIDFKVTDVPPREDQSFILKIPTEITLSEKDKTIITNTIAGIYKPELLIKKKEEHVELFLADKKVLKDEKTKELLLEITNFPVIFLDYDGNFLADIANHISEDLIYLDDGKAAFSLKSKKEGKERKEGKENKCVRVEVKYGEKVELKKSMNLFNNARKSAEFISDIDRIYLKKILTHPDFEDSCPIDSIAVSFVRSSSDLNEIDTMLKMFGVKEKKDWNIKLVAKIESPHCFMKRCDYNQDRFDQKKIDFAEYKEILKNKLCWAVMVARGDLGVEIEPEKVPEIQRILTDEANIAGKGVIVATQMLLSMVSNNRPSRADVTDIHNAVLNGADVVMLSEETAKGDYPIEALQYMRTIINKAVDELMLPEKHSVYLEKILKAEKERKAGQIMDLLGEPMVNISNKSGSPVIFSYALTGGTATRIPRYRPDKPIIAITMSEMAAKNMLFYFGVFPLLIEKKDKNGEPDFPRDVKKYRDFIKAIVNTARDKKDKKRKKFFFDKLERIADGQVVFGLLGIDDKASYLSDRAIVIFRLKEIIQIEKNLELEDENQENHPGT